MFGPVFRFAPSPNGYLHLGHAASALINQRLAQEAGGRLLLRIEDIDLGRSREDYVDAVYEDLAWIGVAWEQPVLRQSLNFAAYRRAADKLVDMGLLYKCFATRAEISAAAAGAGGGFDPDGAPVYPGLHRNMSAAEVERRTAEGEPFAMRLDMAKACMLSRQRAGGEINWREMDEFGKTEIVTADPMAWGDVIIQRKDVPTSYHLSVVVDDACQGVSHIVRGQDLRAATSIHRVLQLLLGLPDPMYRHHGLVRDESGRKLSKSDAATSLRSLRQAGWSLADVIQSLALKDLQRSCCK
ncbi:MAG: tRNA glutamyl-Q(34) synthetase GluQRS [Alphaproteobacteria bacterium]|nr:tRNA glutamyl-Q(34) synthetase GluQRS [Alphaproteobacteria bacterium]